MVRHCASPSSGTRSRFLLVLALCALLIRGLIPNGYMPSANPANAAALSLCVQGDPFLAQWSGQLPGPEHEDQHSLHAACIFAQAQANKALNDEPGPAWDSVSIPQHTWDTAQQAAAPVLPLTGPPLSARGPPSALLS
ncbi:hypothetical protein JYG33_01600 [Alcaligenes sp. SORT26]|uniref:hypothetical protein n=1 Tax=Alcaligenes sp. SORT26 TaxID=2813780 RepID=UPI001A9F30D6|nr:hypothetical protein [Alcaligenes sp. SORT26]QTC00196.1 hypothetical protein JYG33_01600 [Alcaligenes sp. SORT26]